jgi:hypothetical protein
MALQTGAALAAQKKSKHSSSMKRKPLGASKPTQDRLRHSDVPRQAMVQGKTCFSNRPNTLLHPKSAHIIYDTVRIVDKSLLFHDF